MDWEALLSTEYLGNTVMEYVWALGIFLVVYVLLYVFRVVIIAKLHALAEKTATRADDVVIAFLRSIGWPLYTLLALFVAMNTVEVHSYVSIAVRYALLFIVVYYGVRGAAMFIRYGADMIAERRLREDNDHDRTVIDLLARMVSGLLWVLAGLFVLSNIGFEITPLIAGLGIGGLAIAIALQGILTDLFASFTIYFDKPFKIGDFIIVGSDMGVVKHVGMKSTRIQALQGQEIVISNQELTSTRVHNYKKMTKRRVVFSFGVTYETPKKQLEKIPGMVKTIIDKLENAEPDRVHFQKFGDSSLDFEAVYYVDIGDYTVFMDVQQAINLGIVAAFEKAGIHMAYPTRTLYTPDLAMKRVPKKRK